MHYQYPIARAQHFWQQYPASAIHQAHLASQKVPTSVSDTCCTGGFITLECAASASLPILVLSNKIISVADNGILKSQYKTLLPYDLQINAREADNVHDFGRSLVGIKEFADAGCIRIFYKHQGGVTIHNQKDIKIEFLAPLLVSGTHDDTGLWTIPLTNKSQGVHNLRYSIKNPRCPTLTNQANHSHNTLNATDRKSCKSKNVYKIPYIVRGIKWMHAVCWYLAKLMWMEAICAGNYVGCPLITNEHVYRHHPETTKLLKATWTNQSKRSVPRSPNPCRSQPLTTVNSKGKRIVTYISKCTNLRTQRTPTRLAASLSTHNNDKSVSWSWSKLTSMLY